MSHLSSTEIGAFVTGRPATAGACGESPGRPSPRRMKAGHATVVRATHRISLIRLGDAMFFVPDDRCILDFSKPWQTACVPLLI
ncbi:MAG: hypothetical protein EHM16_15450 [Betaproteobacteria bacterium]|nr:MAG: hypothetical protein EHM16_15450 [Betaproteobacteria bacterium]